MLKELYGARNQNWSFKYAVNSVFVQSIGHFSDFNFSYYGFNFQLFFDTIWIFLVILWKLYLFGVIMAAFLFFSLCCFKLWFFSYFLEFFLILTYFLFYSLPSSFSRFTAGGGGLALSPFPAANKVKESWQLVINGRFLSLLFPASFLQRNSVCYAGIPCGWWCYWSPKEKCKAGTWDQQRKPAKISGKENIVKAALLREKKSVCHWGKLELGEEMRGKMGKLGAENEHWWREKVLEHCITEI